MEQNYVTHPTEVTAGLAESNGSLLPGLWPDSLHVTCGLTACTPGSAPGPTLGSEYGKTLPFYPIRIPLRVDCKGTDLESRRFNYDAAGNLTMVVAYCSIFLNPLIYLLRYEVVKRSLINWSRKAAARIRNQPAPTTGWPHSGINAQLLLFYSFYRLYACCTSKSAVRDYSGSGDGVLSLPAWFSRDLIDDVLSSVCGYISK